MRSNIHRQDMKEKNNSQIDHAFLESTRTYAAILSATNFAAWKVLAITTACYIYTLIESNMITYIPEEHITAARVLAICAGYLMVDAGIDQSLSFYFQEKYNKNLKLSPARKLFGKGVFLLIVIRLAASTTSSLWAAPEISAAITGNDNSSYYNELIHGRDTIQNKQVSEALAYSIEMNNSEPERLRKAKKDGDKAIKKAIELGTFWQKKSWKASGFGYIESKKAGASNNKYAASIRKAMSDREWEIDRQKQKTNYANFAYKQLLSDTTHNKLVASWTAAGSTEIADHQQRKARRVKYLYLVQIIAAIIGILCIRALVQRRIAANDFRTRTSSTTTLLRIGGSWYIGFLQWLEDTFGIEIKWDDMANQQSQASKQLRDDGKSLFATFPVNGDDATDDLLNRDDTQKGIENDDQNTTDDNRRDTGNDTNSNGNATDDNRRICVNCGDEYTYKHVKQKFCDDTCRKKNHAQKKKKKGRTT